MAKCRDLLRIGEFAKLADTNLRTLRYYEELGLIEPDSRSEGGFRYYRKDQLDRMEAIRRLQDLGLSLKEIAAAVQKGDTTSGSGVIDRLRPVLENQIGLIEAKIGQLGADLEELKAARQRLLDLCRHCEVPFSHENCDPCPRDRVPMPAVLRALL